MARPKFIRLSGWALMTGAAAFLPFLIEVMLGLTRYSPLLIDWYALDFLASFGLVYGSVLLPIGMLGLRARYGGHVGELGKGILLAGALGGGTLVVTMLYGTKFLPEDIYLYWGIFMTGLSLQFLSLLLFGVLAWVRKPLPRGNGLPIAAGLSAPMFIKLSATMMGVGFYVENPIFIIVLSAVGFVFMTIALIRLGYILQASEPYEAAEI